MLFKDNIPDSVLENSQTQKFVTVLDELQKYKSEIIGEFTRFQNYGTLTNRDWVIKNLLDFGFSGVHPEYPLPPLIQLLLNINNVYGTRGSKVGIELYCSVLSLGEVTVDDSAFFPQPIALLLDSLEQGYIAKDSSLTIPRFFLAEDNSINNPEVTLGINIKSKYFNGYYSSEAQLIDQFIRGTIRSQLAFSPNLNLNLTFESRESFYYHSLLNKYFTWPV